MNQEHLDKVEVAEVAAINQARFDELAKGLATKRLSRRQVFKGLTAALIGTALGMNLQPRTASAAKLCPTRVARRGWNPNEHVNECGTKPLNRLAARMIQDMGAEVDFTPACNQHDICYSTCNAVKTNCDEAFRLQMTQICCDAFPTDSEKLFDCQQWATRFWLAVYHAGHDEYANAQASACTCCTPGHPDLQYDDQNESLCLAGRGPDPSGTNARKPE